MVTAPPNPVLMDGKDYYEVAAMNAHLKDLRAENARLGYDISALKQELSRAQQDRDNWRLQALGPK